MIWVGYFLMGSGAGLAVGLLVNWITDYNQEKRQEERLKAAHTLSEINRLISEIGNLKKEIQVEQDRLDALTEEVRRKCSYYI